MRSSTAISLTLQLAAVSVVIGHFELFARRRELVDEGWMSWSVASLRRRWTEHHVAGHGLRFILAYPGFLGLLIANATLASIFIPAFDLGSGGRIAALLVFVGLLSLAIRMPYGLEGADQMNLAIFGVVGITAAAPGSTLASEASLWFICLQSSLSYFNSWRNQAFFSCVA